MPRSPAPIAGRHPGPPLPGRHRQPCSWPARVLRPRITPSLHPVKASVSRAAAPAVVELVYETCVGAPGEVGGLSESLYEGYTLQSLRILGARPHPTRLVQSAAMASVAPPKPSYRPHLPERALSAGLLSDAQLESVIRAGEAHAGHLAGFGRKQLQVVLTSPLVSADPKWVLLVRGAAVPPPRNPERRTLR